MLILQAPFPPQCSGILNAIQYLTFISKATGCDLWHVKKLLNWVLTECLKFDVKLLAMNCPEDLDESFTLW